MAVAGGAERVEVCDEDRRELERIVRAVELRGADGRVGADRAIAAEGMTAAAIAERVGCGGRGEEAARALRRDEMEGLRDAPRSGAPLTHGPGSGHCCSPRRAPGGGRPRRARGRERWTYRELGEAVGMSGSQAHVILSRAEIKPHRTDYWMMSDFSHARVRGAPGRDLRALRRPARERAGRLDRREDRNPGQVADQARSGRRRPASRPGASTNTSATAPSACSRT